MQVTAELVSVTTNDDDSIQVTLPNGYGISYINRAALEFDVNQRLDNAVSSMIWLLLNDYLVNGNSSGICFLDTNEPNGNWIKKQ
jgi:hypothetical protein